MSDDELEQSNFQYEIFGGCHDFWWQQIIIFPPSTNLLSIAMDVRVGVKFLEWDDRSPGWWQGGGGGGRICFSLPSSCVSGSCQTLSLDVWLHSLWSQGAESGPVTPLFKLGFIRLHADLWHVHYTSQKHKVTHGDIRASQGDDRDLRQSGWRTHDLSEMDDVEAKEVFVIHLLIRLFPLPSVCPAEPQNHCWMPGACSEFQVSK